MKRGSGEIDRKQKQKAPLNNLTSIMSKSTDPDHFFQTEYVNPSLSL